MDVIVDSINKHLKNGSNIYVHCIHGISRSAAIIIYYLMKYEKMSLNRAYGATPYGIDSRSLLIMRSCISPLAKFIKVLKTKIFYANDDDDFLRIKIC
jgi:predicted protein tyrosine phosphatase